MDRDDAETIPRAIGQVRAVADAALVISQHLILRLALHQAEPAEWLKESFEEMMAHIDEKTAGGETAKWAAVRIVVGETAQKLANELARLSDQKP